MSQRLFFFFWVLLGQLTRRFISDVSPNLPYTERFYPQSNNAANLFVFFSCLSFVHVNRNFLRSFSRGLIMPQPQNGFKGELAVITNVHFFPRRRRGSQESGTSRDNQKPHQSMDARRAPSALVAKRALAGIFRFCAGYMRMGTLVSTPSEKSARRLKIDIHFGETKNSSRCPCR